MGGGGRNLQLRTGELKNPSLDFFFLRTKDKAQIVITDSAVSYDIIEKRMLYEVTRDVNTGLYADIEDLENVYKKRFLVIRSAQSFKKLKQVI